VLSGIDLIGVVTGEAAGTWVLLAAVFGLTLTLLGLGFVEAAAAAALVEIDSERPIGVFDAYRLAWRHRRPLLGAITIWVAVLGALTLTIVLIPVAIWLGVRWALVAPAVVLEDRRRPRPALRRSGELVSHHWIRVASLVGVSRAFALLLGPLLGAILILVADAPLAFVNIVAGVVYALTMPFVALVTAYVYFDTRARLELEPKASISELPAEITLEA
jgi:hypothetical protein